MKKISSYGLVLLLAAAGVLMLSGCGSGGSGEHPGKDTGMQGMSGMNMPSMTAAAGHKITGIELDQLIRPTDGFVLSSVPVTAIRSDTIQPQLAVLGTISYDTRLTNTISARVSGRIERLYVRYRYQHVHKGDRILDIYSPELQTGEQEYLYLLKNDPENKVLVDAARQKLLLLGVGERQLDEVARSGRPLPVLTVYSGYTGHIHDAGTMPEGDKGMGGTETTAALPIKEGMYIEKGQPIFQVFNMDHSWAVLNLFPGQEGLVRRGDPVDIVPETAPDKAFNGQVDLVEPLYRQGLRSATVRVYFDNSTREIPIGSAIKATIRPTAVRGSWLSADAVLSLGNRQVVFLRTDGGFRAHAVTTGITDGQRIQILAGLNTGDSVAANAQFLVDSEDFIKVND